MTFWITSSIILFLVLMVSVFGPFLGIYGDVEKEEQGEDS